MTFDLYNLVLQSHDIFYKIIELLQHFAKNNPGAQQVGSLRQFLKNLVSIQNTKHTLTHWARNAPSDD